MFIFCATASTPSGDPQPLCRTPSNTGGRSFSLPLCLSPSLHLPLSLTATGTGAMSGEGELSERHLQRGGYHRGLAKWMDLPVVVHQYICCGPHDGAAVLGGRSSGCGGKEWNAVVTRRRKNEGRGFGCC